MGIEDLPVSAFGTLRFNSIVFIDPRPVGFGDGFHADTAFASPTGNTANHRFAL
jgi:hypothetical protein